MLRTLVIPAVFAVIASTHMSAQGVPEPSPVITDDESYAVYAAALPHASDANDPRQATITIQLETAMSEVCPMNRPVSQEWRAVIAAYRRENNHTKFLRPGFPLGRTYSLIPAAEVRKLLADAGYLSPDAPITNAPGARVFSKFPGERLFVFSAIGFNAEKTRAIVTVQRNCMPPVDGRTFCEAGDTMPLEKKDGQWHPAQVAYGCTWIVQGADVSDDVRARCAILG